MPEVALTLSFDSHSSAKLDKQLEAFSGEIKDFQKHARKLGNYVKNQAIKNIRAQKTIDGRSFPSRAKARSEYRAKRRLLQGLADPTNSSRKLAVVSNAQDGGGVMVTYKNGLTAEIGAVQQYGSGSRKISAKEAKKEKGGKLPNYNKPCTRDQAKALIAAGYRLPIPAKGGGRGPGRNKMLKRVSVQWLEKHFSIGHAGLVLRILKTGKLKGKQDWKTGIAPRPFLGVTQDQAGVMSEKLAKTLAKAAEQGRKQS